MPNIYIHIIIIITILKWTLLLICLKEQTNRKIGEQVAEEIGIPPSPLKER